MPTEVLDYISAVNGVFTESKIRLFDIVEECAAMTRYRYMQYECVPCYRKQRRKYSSHFF